eukprot:SAG31_NODE_1610_length_7751_cov_2.938447_1_plen_205_part_00
MFSIRVRVLTAESMGVVMGGAVNAWMGFRERIVSRLLKWLGSHGSLEAIAHPIWNLSPLRHSAWHLYPRCPTSCRAALALGTTTFQTVCRTTTPQAVFGSTEMLKPQVLERQTFVKFMYKTQSRDNVARKEPTTVPQLVPATADTLGLVEVVTLVKPIAQHGVMCNIQVGTWRAIAAVKVIEIFPFSEEKISIVGALVNNNEIL